MTEKKNIYQKLIEVRKQIPYLKKDAEGFGYKYAKGSVLLSLLRPKMDELGLFLSYDVTEMETEEVVRQKFDKKLFKTILVNQGRVKLKYVFTFVDSDNPKDTVVKDHWFQGVGDDIQDIGSYDTYALRYFLLGFFNIPSDKDDPDEHDNAVEKSTPVECISPDQVKEIKDLIGDDQKIMDNILKNIDSGKLKNLEIERFPSLIRNVKIVLNKKKGVIDVN